MTRLSSTRSSLACLPCRNQHLRCDTAQPTCSRCWGLSRPCYYPESRRTGRYRASSARRAAEETSRLFITGAPGQSLPSIDNSNSNFLESPEPSTINILNTRPRHGPATDPFLSLYYQHFHSNHPFLLPRPALERAIDVDTASPSLLHLATTMRYIGSVYAGTPSDLPAVPDASQMACQFKRLYSYHWRTACFLRRPRPINYWPELSSKPATSACTPVPLPKPQKSPTQF